MQKLLAILLVACLFQFSIAGVVKMTRKKVTPQDNKLLRDSQGLASFRNFDVIYYGPLGVGSAGNTYNMIFDSGSFALWFPAQDCQCEYDPAKQLPRNDINSCTNTWKNLYYGSGVVRGQMCSANIFLQDMNVSVNNMIWADAANLADGSLAGISGIMGLDNVKKVKNVIQFAYEQKLIPSQIYGMQLKNYSQQSEFHYGDISSDIISSANWQNTIMDDYWTINMTSFLVDSTNVQGSALLSSMIDSGTSQILTPPNVYNAMIQAIVKAVGSKNSEVFIDGRWDLVWCDQIQNLPNFYVHTPTMEVTVTPENYTDPRTDDNQKIIPNQCVIGIGNAGNPQPGMPSVILGEPFLRASYVLFNKETQQVGFHGPQVQGKLQLFRLDFTPLILYAVGFLLMVVGGLIMLFVKIKY